MSDKAHETGTPGQRDYADRDIRLRPLVIFFVVAAVVTGVTIVGISAFFGYLDRKMASEDGTYGRFSELRVLPPAPLLQVDEKRTLEQQRAVEEAQLSSYGWVDRTGGVVRIPVQRAIALTAERGLPARAAKEGAAR